MPTSAVSFSSILDKPSSEIERPKPAPVGTYTVLIQGQPRFDKSSKKQTPFVEFALQYLAAGEDVDEDSLTDWLAGKKLKDMSIKSTYYLTDSAAWRLVEFLDHCGAGDEDMTPRQRIAETPGKQVVISIGHEASDDGTAIFARVKGTAAAE